MTPEGSEHDQPGDPSVSQLTAMIHSSGDQEEDYPHHVNSSDKKIHDRPATSSRSETTEANERTVLLGDRKADSIQHGHVSDLERQYTSDKSRFSVLSKLKNSVERARSYCYVLSHPKTWSARAVYRDAVMHPASLLPAVFLGLLLNILDALSYGMILFPFGK